MIKAYDEAVTHSLNYGVDLEQSPITKIVRNLNLEKILNELKNISAENNFIFHLYYNLYKGFTNLEDESYYFEYKNSLIQHSDLISRDEKQFLYGRLLDYCVLKNRNKSRHDFEQELFNIHELFLIYEYYKT